MFFSILFVIVIYLLIHLILTRRYNYWKVKNVPHNKPKLLFGNYKDQVLLKKPIGEVLQDILKPFPNEPMVGAYILTEPVLLIQDPDLIKLVTTKDYYYFCNREVSDHVDKESGTSNVFSTHGNKWRVLRQNLSPLFSSAKMRNMFYLIDNCCKELETLLDRELKISETLDVKTVMARYTIDCICSSVFGIESKVMTANNYEGNLFKMIGDGIFDFSTSKSMLTYVRRCWPTLFYALGYRNTSEKVTNALQKVLLDVFKERNYRPSQRHDFVDLLLSFRNKQILTGDSIANLKNKNNEKAELEVTDDLLIAQCVVFFGAGFETSAKTLGHTLYELAKDRRAQDLALAEVDRYMAEYGELNYDCYNRVPYLDQCVDEALRLYPLSTVIAREVYEGYTFPNGVHVERGTRIHLPVIYLQRNPKFFPDPDTFRPERFSPEEKHKISPYTYLPFGDGPRICIGMRFAKMVMSAALITVLKKYRVELAEDMPATLPLETRTWIPTSICGIKLKLIPRF